jgi:hypothetical protein
MLATETAQTTTQHEPATDAMSDAKLREHLVAFEANMQDGLTCNFPYLWKTAADLQSQNVTGDAFIVALALASLTKVPRYGVRCSHAQIARRASTLKKLFALSVLGITTESHLGKR